MNQLHEAGRVVGVLQIVAVIRGRMNAIAEEEICERPNHEQAGEPGATPSAWMAAGGFQELEALAEHLLAEVKGPCPS